MGGDGIFSINLFEENSEIKNEEKKILWFFGDTFINVENPKVRKNSSEFPSNTIAISSCKDGKFTYKYYWRTEDSKKKFTNI